MENNLQLLQDFRALNISAILTLKNAIRDLKVIHESTIQTHLNYDDNLISLDDYISIVDYYYTQAKTIMDNVGNNIKIGLYNYVDSYAYDCYRREIYNIFEEINVEYYESLEV